MPRDLHRLPAIQAGTRPVQKVWVDTMTPYSNITFKYRVRCVVCGACSNSPNDNKVLPTICDGCHAHRDTR